MALNIFTLLLTLQVVAAAAGALPPDQASSKATLQAASTTASQELSNTVAPTSSISSVTPLRPNEDVGTPP